MILVLAIVAGALTAVLLFRTFFEDLSDFGECIRFWLTPDIISLVRGEWGEDSWAELKLIVYFAISVGVGVLTNYTLQKYWG